MSAIWLLALALYCAGGVWFAVKMDVSEDDALSAVLVGPLFFVGLLLMAGALKLKDALRKDGAA